MWNLMMSLFSLVFHRCKEEKIKVQIKLFFMVYRLRFQYGKNLSSVRLIFIQTLWGPPCRWCLKGASKATLDFKKRCVSESSPHTCMCLYVRRSKSSIPSTFSDILDKSFLNEQTSLCFRRKGKKLDRGDERMETFLCWIFIVGKALTVSNVMRSKLNLRSDFVPKNSSRVLCPCSKLQKSRLTRIPEFIRRKRYAWTTTPN